MNTQEFIGKLEQDEKENNLVVIEKIQAAGQNPEAIYAIARETGVTDSFEVFQSEMTHAYKTMTSELSEEELLTVAGGMTDGETAAAVGGVLVGLTAAGSVAGAF